LRWRSILLSILAGSLARDNPAMRAPGSVRAVAPENTHPARTSASQDEPAGRGLTSFQSQAWVPVAGMGRILAEFHLLTLFSTSTGDFPTLVCYNCALLESLRPLFLRESACLPAGQHERIPQDGAIASGSPSGLSSRLGKRSVVGLLSSLPRRSTCPRLRLSSSTGAPSAGWMALSHRLGPYRRDAEIRRVTRGAGAPPKPRKGTCGRPYS